MTQTKQPRIIEYDGVHNEWICHLGGPGNPKIICDDKSKMEDFLDWLDNKCKEVSHVVPESKEAAVDRDWRGAEAD